MIKHILLIFKYYVYETIEDGSLDLKVFFKKTLICVENIERQIKLKKQNNFEQKWKPLLGNTQNTFWYILWCDSWVGE